MFSQILNGDSFFYVTVDIVDAFNDRFGQKIEKATHLLRYSDQSIVDIAAYLSFSSQSHFIQIFEGYIGLSPKKYRDKYYKSMW